MDAIQQYKRCVHVCVCVWVWYRPASQPASGIVNKKERKDKNSCDLSSVSQFHLTAQISFVFILAFLKLCASERSVLLMVTFTQNVKFVIPGNTRRRKFSTAPAAPCLSGLALIRLNPALLLLQCVAIMWLHAEKQEHHNVLFCIYFVNLTVEENMGGCKHNPSDERNLMEHSQLGAAGPQSLKSTSTSFSPACLCGCSLCS